MRLRAARSIGIVDTHRRACGASTRPTWLCIPTFRRGCRRPRERGNSCARWAGLRHRLAAARGGRARLPRPRNRGRPGEPRARAPSDAQRTGPRRRRHAGLGARHPAAGRVLRPRRGHRVPAPHRRPAPRGRGGAPRAAVRRQHDGGAIHPSLASPVQLGWPALRNADRRRAAHDATAADDAAPETVWVTTRQGRDELFQDFAVVRIERQSSDPIRLGSLRGRAFWLSRDQALPTMGHAPGMDLYINARRKQGSDPSLASCR